MDSQYVVGAADRTVAAHTHSSCHSEPLEALDNASGRQAHWPNRLQEAKHHVSGFKPLTCVQCTHKLWLEALAPC